jgi:MFS family permease
MAARFPRQVWLLGWASLLTDAATEIVYPLLPVYLARVLGAGPASLGIIEGVAEGVNSLLKIVSGRMADRRGRRPLVLAGYALSSAARPFIALATSWTHVLLVRAIDRTGKGIRGAPRDAMLAGLASRESRGRVFGFHRAMDHTGAIIGPVLATLFLVVWPGELRTLFALTIVPGALAVVVLLFVRETASSSSAGLKPRPANESGANVGPGFSPAAHTPLPRRLWALLAVILIFSLGSSADAFLLLRLTEALGSATFVPLLWSAHHVVKAGLSTWGGSMSDRFGRRPMIVAGWAIYAAVYLGFAWSTSAETFIAWFLFYGVYFALTEGAEKALVADLAPPERHGLAFGVYNAALGAGALLASVGFGVVYERFGAAPAFTMGAAFASVAAILLLLVPLTPDAAGRSEDRPLRSQD